MLRHPITLSLWQLGIKLSHLSFCDDDDPADQRLKDRQLKWSQSPKGLQLPHLEADWSQGFGKPQAPQKFSVPSPLRPQTPMAIEKLNTAASEAQARVNNIEDEIQIDLAC